MADSWNHRIRRVDIATGQTTTLAGSVPGFQDGEVTSLDLDAFDPCTLNPDP